MNLRDLMLELNIQFVAYGEHHHAREGWLQTDCPFCSPGTGRYLMGWSESAHYCSCWKCGSHRFVEALAASSTAETKDILKLTKGLEKSGFVADDKRGKLELPRGLGPLGEKHKAYLRGRGYNATRTAKLWKLQGIGISAQLAWRVFIPIHYRGEVVSWTTRSIRKDCTMRYISAAAEQEIYNHKHLLFGADFVSSSAVVHEGPLDAIRVGPGAVALCGTAFTAAQVEKLARIPNRFICFDNEPEAQRRAKALANALAPFGGRTVNITLDAKDAGEASEKELRELRAFAGID